MTTVYFVSKLLSKKSIPGRARKRTGVAPGCCGRLRFSSKNRGKLRCHIQDTGIIEINGLSPHPNQITCCILVVIFKVIRKGWVRSRFPSRIWVLTAPSSVLSWTREVSYSGISQGRGKWPFCLTHSITEWASSLRCFPSGSAWM